MSRENKLSLHQQVYNKLQEMEGFGRSKHKDKILHLNDKYIYSFNSMKAYLKHCHYFVEWCKNNPDIKRELGHKPRTLDECFKYVEQYIRSREAEGLSAYTIKLEKSALSKLYQYNFQFDTVQTKRKDIKRSRGQAIRDSHFSEVNNADMINACRCVGFRRSELEKAKADDLIELNGRFFMNIQGKGGRSRSAMLYGTDAEIQQAVDYIKTLNGHNKVNSNADIHSYRADYATRVYNTHKRDIERIKGVKMDYTEATGKTKPDGQHIYKSAVYYCKGDRKGVKLDRLAMIIASQCLGHNRESVVGEHYIRLID